MQPAQKKQRFVLYSEEELQNKHEASRNYNTTKCEDRANAAFQKFLQQGGKTDMEYWLYKEDELDLMLEKFWFGARKDPGDDYQSDSEDVQKVGLMHSANTMRNFRYALNRILKNKGHLYDIISPSSLSFKRSQKAFNASQKELKELGKAAVTSAPEITEDGERFLCFGILVVPLRSLFLFLKQKDKNVTKFYFANISAHRCQEA